MQSLVISFYFHFIFYLIFICIYINVCYNFFLQQPTVEELTCLAAWKDGNARYLVGLVSHNHATSNEERFRCFVYENINRNSGKYGKLFNLGLMPNCMQYRKIINFIFNGHFMYRKFLLFSSMSCVQ